MDTKEKIKTLAEQIWPVESLKQEALSLSTIFTMVEQQMEELAPLLEQRRKITELLTEDEQKEITVKLPIIRLSEKMWGKEGTEDRAIIQNLLQKIVHGGGSLRDRIIKVANFVTTPPATRDISEILTYIVLLDTLTNIMLHFNASAAGFTFEGFLAALLRGEQIPAGGQSGIQDIIDNDKAPISLKLLTEEGQASVEGSYRDLVDHFIDPGGLKQDPESKEYVGQAGAEGTMTYVVALKSFRETGAEAALTAETAASIHFYQFDFNAENFLHAMRSNPHNITLLLLPEDLKDDPSDDEAATHVASGDRELEPEELVRAFYGDDYNTLKQDQRQYLKNIAQVYDADYAKELFKALDIVQSPGRGAALLRWNENAPEDAKPGAGMKGPSMGKRQPKIWEPLRGDERRREVGTIVKEKYLDARTSIRMLENALAESPDKFWGLIARSLGYAGVLKGYTQFDINRAYYENRSYSTHGLGYIGSIPVGKAAVSDLAQKYVDVLNQQIFDLFEKVELLANQINAYFIGGDKTKGLAAADTAQEISAGQREYIKTAGDEFAGTQSAEPETTTTPARRGRLGVGLKTPKYSGLGGQEE